jgi:hypothetical protein
MALKQPALFFSFIACSIVGALAAEQPRLVAPLALESGAAETRIADYTHVFAHAEAELPLTREILATVSAWLSANFGLPAAGDLPQVQFASAARIAALRYRHILPGRTQDGPTDNSAMLGADRDIVAVYDSAAQTIYLPEDWNASSPTDMSVLVHEMVHHLQNRGQLKYNCPEEREKLAYAAQEKWLALTGHSLVKDFDIDGFTLLAKTLCMR